MEFKPVYPIAQLPVLAPRVKRMPPQLPAVGTLILIPSAQDALCAVSSILPATNKESGVAFGSK